MQIAHCQHLQSLKAYYKPKGILFLLAMAIFLFGLQPFSAAHAENNVKASLTSKEASIKAGEPIHIGVQLEAGAWHTYYKEPGDAGLPTKLKWQLPDGFTAGEIEWPEPTKFSEGTLTTYGYTGTITLPVTITTPQQLIAKSYEFKVKAEWLACKDICIPESQELSITLPVEATAASQNNNTTATDTLKKKTSEVEKLSLLTIILSAVLGGLILNIMPCVLPILSLKALALVQKSGQTRKHTINYGIAYTLGVLVSFALIASILIFLQKGGEAIGWGFQMQSPAFVGFLIYLLFLVGLNLSGMFQLPVLMGSVGGNLTNTNTIRGSFFTGILATLVATPCTAPFMASAVGAALTLPAWAAMLTFLSLGFGLALPFLLISIFPNLLRFLPKPGEWMERFKEFLAFPMYCAVIWLIWVLGMQVGIDGVALVISGLLLIVFIIWIQRIASECKQHHRFFTIISVTVMLAAILYSLQHSEPAKTNTVDSVSIPYSASALASLRTEGKAVYVDATAAWCITCQLNKRVALDTTATKQAFKDRNITLMVADWTRQSPEITEFLHSFGYNGVPLNVFYPAGGGDPIVLPQILSEQIVLDNISK